MSSIRRYRYRVTAIKPGGLLQVLGLAFLVSGVGRGQTSCGVTHTGTGTFLCYPQAAAGTTGVRLPDIFHLSAQANAPDGRTIDHYWVSLDDKRIYEQRLVVAQQQLSIELNLKSPFPSGAHTLRVTAAEAGTAEISGLSFYPSATIDRCNPEAVGETRTCSLLRSGEPFAWSIAGKSADYKQFRELFERNMKSVEADVSDAAAVDGQGHLYVASHSFADLELRKYDRSGSIVYDSVLRACGEGFLAVAGLSVDESGKAWVAFNTDACFATTGSSPQQTAGSTPGRRGMVVHFDTAKPSSEPAVYVTAVSTVKNRVAAIRVDAEGNAYLVGETAWGDFPHQNEIAAAAGTGVSGFVCVLDAAGSRLLWSTILKGIEPSALALSGRGEVFVAGNGTSGKAPGDLLLMGLSDRGSRLSYAGHAGAAGEARAIAMAEGSWLLVAGEGESQPFLLASQTCRSGASHLISLGQGELPIELATSSALDAFAKVFKPMKSSPCQ